MFLHCRSCKYSSFQLASNQTSDVVFFFGGGVGNMPSSKLSVFAVLWNVRGLFVIS